MTGILHEAGFEQKELRRAVRECTEPWPKERRPGVVMWRNWPAIALLMLEMRTCAFVSIPFLGCPISAICFNTPERHVQNHVLRGLVFLLTNRIGCSILLMRTYSTAKVAKILGVGTETIYRWMHEGKVPTPSLKSLGGMRIRLWSEDDLRSAKKYKAENYWGKGGRQKRKKQSR